MGEYDFIMNPGSAPKKKSFGVPSISGGSNSQRSLLLLIAGGGVLVVIGLILYSMYGGRPDNSAQLIGIAKQQQELIRVAGIGVKESRGTQAKNLAVTAQLSLTSDQTPLLAAFKAKKIRISAKTLGGAKDVKTDQLLETAKNNNRFDEEFMDFMQQQLVEYQKNLKAAYDDTAPTHKVLKEAMKIQYENASIIIGVDPET